MTAREIGVGEALAEGRMDPRVLPGSLRVSAFTTFLIIHGSGLVGKKPEEKKSDEGG